MANHLRVPDNNRFITWRQGKSTTTREEALDFVVRDTEGNPIAKAKLTASQLHKFICMHNTMK